MLEQVLPALSGTIFDDLLLLIVGLFLLVKGSTLFVQAAGSVAKRFGISELVIGLTLVAIGTSLPELVAAIVASLKNEGALVLGNVVGANIANMTLIIGGAAALRAMPIERPMLERDGYLALAAAIVLTSFAFNGVVSRVEGAVFLVVFFAYMAFLVQTSQQYEASYHIRQFATYFFKLGYVTGPARAFTRSMRRDSNVDASRPPFDWRSAALLSLSVVLVVAGGNVLVDEAVFFAHYFNFPVTLMGVVLALGTTAPEMSVSIAAARQGMGGMVVGNALGSVLCNTFLIVGVASTIAPVPVSFLALRYALPCLIAVTVILLVFKKTDHEIHRLEGIGLCASYVIFIVVYGVLA